MHAMVKHLRHVDRDCYSAVLRMQMAGGRAVPIEYDLPQSEVRKRCFHCLYILHAFLHKMMVRCAQATISKMLCTTLQSSFIIYLVS